MTAAEVSLIFHVSLFGDFGSGETRERYCAALVVINLQPARKDLMMITDHTAVNLNDWNNKHCTQGCDCFFVEEELPFLCL